jgi:hypothetical protein
MTNPTPPGDIPLYDGLGAEWNDVFSAIPEDIRGTVGSAIKGKVSSYDEKLNSYKSWDDVIKNGDPDFVKTAIGVYQSVENRPKEVFELLGRHLGISTEQAKEVAQELEDDNSGDPVVAQLKQQVDTLSQIILSQKQEEIKNSQLQQQEAALAKELDAVKAKYGEFDEEQILWRMDVKGMSAEDAYKDYEKMVDGIRTKKPAPMVLGQSGSIPRQAIDPRKLDDKDTKNLVAQLLQQSLPGR